MEQADFVHMVRMSEHASAENSRAYRLSVGAFAMLGYAWVLGCLALGAGLVGWAGLQLLQGRFRLGAVLLLLTAGGLFWVSLRALWVRLDAPEGVEITALEAPALFDALERIRRKIRAPMIHHVRLSDEFNASIQQVPRYGLLGGSVNHLTIGLPLLMALNRPRFLAILAHEYGHLRGDHGRFAAWIYRSRLAWMRLHHGLQDDASPVTLATQAFLRWYFPRFSAKTFALARQDEYEADRIAGRLMGRDVAAAALTEIEVRGAWMQSEFWARHWSKAAENPLPVGPYRSLRRRLARMPDPAFANDALRQALQRISGVDDTHPVLRDRIEALDTPPILPDWSHGNAMELLGSDAKRWLAQFDKQWCRDHASEWKLHHAWLMQVRERVRVLDAGMAQNQAQDLVELARLMRLLDPRAVVRPLYEQALERDPQHAGALRGLVQNLPDADREAKLDGLQRLWDCAGDDRWWTARTALAELETSRSGMEHDAAAYKQWRRRLDRAQEVEDRVWEELTSAPFFGRTKPHDLSAFEQAELKAGLMHCLPVAQAWLVSKNLREAPLRRAYLLCVELPGLDEEDSFHLCRSLERQLNLPGPVLVLWPGESPTLQEIQRYAGTPVFQR